MEAESGGETGIVDGANVLREFSTSHRSEHKLLAAKSFAFTCSENIHTSRHSLFDNDIIRHNHGDMQMTELDEYRVWNELTLDPFFKYETTLTKGETIVIDNHRVFHARNSFVGRRNLKGCYFQ